MEKARKSKAEMLAEHIVKHWHCCPVDSSHNVSDCDGWGDEKCKKCILKNVEHLE